MTDIGKVIILFGVSGCGKSLIGKKLSLDLKFKFILKLYKLLRRHKVFF